MRRRSAGTFGAVNRSCARPGCGTPRATLSYAYADGVVVLEDLAEEAHPMVHDLCARTPTAWGASRVEAAGRAVVTVRDRPTGRRHASSGQLDLIGA